MKCFALFVLALSNLAPSSLPMADASSTSGPRAGARTCSATGSGCSTPARAGGRPEQPSSSAIRTARNASREIVSSLPRRWTTWFLLTMAALYGMILTFKVFVKLATVGKQSLKFVRSTPGRHLAKSLWPGSVATRVSGSTLTTGQFNSTWRWTYENSRTIHLWRMPERVSC